MIFVVTMFALLTLVLPLAFSFQVVKADPKTWIVDDDGGADFNTIQEAINAASEGDTVLVCNGTYYEHLTINKSLSLIGESKWNTIIDGNSTGDVVCITSNETKIINFTIQYGYSGISLIHCRDNNLSSNILLNNCRGVAVQCSNDNLIFHNDFINNTQQAYDYSWDNPDPPSTNIWDNGYPSGGNHWSDYTGNDTYKGPFQNITCSDGIGDIPYEIDQNNEDDYPLMLPWDDPYNHQAAYDYAHEYWNRVCSDEYYWYYSYYPPWWWPPGTPLPSEPHYDCAHFVSCCIGNEPNEKGGGLNVPSRTLPAYGEPGVGRLKDWLLFSSGYGVQKYSVNQLIRGDVIFYRWPGHSWGGGGVHGERHSALYLGNGLIASHDYSRWNADWYLDPDDPWEEAVFVHIKGPLPQVSTMSASGVGSTYATLNGYLHSTGWEDCEVWFVWDTTYHSSYQYYSHSTPHQSKSSTGSFSRYISSLTPGVEYHFRAVAKNYEGTVQGVDLTFIPPPLIQLPEVSTRSASGVGSTYATLNGYLDSTGGETCKVWFQYGTSTSYGTETPKVSKSSTGSFSRYISGLTPDTTYHFRAVARNSAGTDYGVDLTFTTLSPPVADFHYSPLKPWTSNTVQFYDDSTDSDGWIVGWYWDFGDNWTSNQQNPTHQYDDDGTYTVTLTVTDNDGLSDDRSKSITIRNVPPTAYIDYIDHSPAFQGETVDFSGYGSDPDGYIIDYRWESSIDGFLSSSSSFSTSSLSVGTHTIYFKVKDDDDDWSSYDRGSLEIIQCNPQLDVSPNSLDFGTMDPDHTDQKSFTVENTGTCTLNWQASESCSWIASVSPSSGSLDAGETDTVWVYVDTTGLQYGETYSCLIDITSNNGSETVTVQVEIAPNVFPPVADFYWTPPIPEVDESVTFNASASTPNGGTIIKYEWNFGDAKTGTGKIVTHTYTSSGTYTVTLNVTDSEGLWDTKQKQIQVVPPDTTPPTIIIISPENKTYITTSIPLTFTVNEPTSWIGYSLDNQANITITGNITLIGLSEGAHSIIVYANDTAGNMGASKTVYFTVALRYGPTAEFTVTPETANVDETVEFDASASQPGWNGTHEMPITEYRWDFGDGNQTTTSTPIVHHSFSSSGNYYVTLTVYAPGATPETDSTTHRVTVVSVPVGGYSYSVNRYTFATPVMFYTILVAILASAFVKIKRKTQKRKKHT